MKANTRTAEKTQKAVGQLQTEVSQASKDTQQSISDLRRAFSDLENATAAARNKDLADIAENPSRDVVYRALSEAAKENTISPRWGIRIPVRPDDTRYVRFEVYTGDLRLIVEDWSGIEACDVTWCAGETPIDAVLKLSKAMKATSMYPGNSFDPGYIFEELSGTLRLAKRVKERSWDANALSGAQQYVPPQWMIFDWGIGSWEFGGGSYCIQAHRFKESDWIPHMRGKPGIDIGSFGEALSTGKKLLEHGRLEG